MSTEEIKPGDTVVKKKNSLISYVVISVDYETGMALCLSPIEWEKEFPLISLEKLPDKRITR